MPITRLVVRGSLSSVANELESANHLANGEKSKALSEDDAASNELAGSQAAGLLEEVLGRLEDGAAPNGLPQGLVEGLEGSNGRRAHLLGMEDDLAGLEGDLAVVNGLRGLLLNEVDQLAGSSTDLAERVGDATSSAGNGRSSSASDARQALRSLCLVLLGLGGSVLGGLGGLVGGGALAAAESKLAQSRRAEHRTSK